METIELRNKHKDKIIDIIGSYAGTRNNLRKNREKILKYLNETVEISEDALKQPIQFLIDTLPNEVFHVETLQELRMRSLQFMTYIISIPEGKLGDGGYSLLLSYYFYISEQLI